MYKKDFFLIYISSQTHLNQHTKQMRLRIKVGSRVIWWPVKDASVSVQALVSTVLAREQPADHAQSKHTVMMDGCEVLGYSTVETVLRDGELIECV